MPCENEESEKVYMAVSKLPGQTYDGISFQTGVAEESVKQIVDRLAEKGLVTYEENGDGKTHVYPVSAEDIKKTWFKEDS